MEVPANTVYRALVAARAAGASDVHVIPGEVPAIRLDGAIVRPGEDERFRALAAPFDIYTRRIEAGSIREFLTIAAPDNRAAGDLGRDGVFDAAFDGGDAVGAVRIHAFSDIRGCRLAVRMLASAVPPFAQLGLPPVVLELFAAKSGLVLFCGPTGSGKTTAQAACVQHLLDDDDVAAGLHVMTLEDPIEYRLHSKRSVVSQIEVGSGAQAGSYRASLASILRADPDILMIGEARDPFALQAVIELAEQGRMATTSVHARDASSVFDRVIGAFAPDTQAHVRTQLANAISAVVVLRLLPRSDGPGRIAASEILVATDAVRAFVRDGQTEQIRNAIITGRELRMQTLESDLSRLVDEGKIAPHTARRAAIRADQLRAGGAAHATVRPAMPAAV